ncbi:concanavalin A-like lectin/glucanase [Rozella allomycis CSF55]|uniref:Concanavalin A-like lectin/glucanase n=1 Tax=Rozella allomycis (strain CSF55) TaxID=988480 RepID=A0A4P9YM86_ROZAC|nr:concanavalin A-like lectin/glucanase [Rozella allomycis CSF55]
MEFFAKIVLVMFALNISYQFNIDELFNGLSSKDVQKIVRLVNDFIAEQRNTKPQAISSSTEQNTYGNQVQRQSEPPPASNTPPSNTPASNTPPVSPTNQDNSKQDANQNNAPPAPVNSSDSYSTWSANLANFQKSDWCFDIWTAETGRDGNGEAQDYTDSPDVIYSKNGSLYLHAIRKNGRWYAPRIKSNVGFDYGRFEATVTLTETVPGAFPAVWMLPGGDGNDSFHWPYDGEIDIFEYNQGWGQIAVNQGAHYGAKNRDKCDCVASKCAIQPNKPMIFAVEKTPDRLTFFCDGTKSHEINNPNTGNKNDWPFNLRKFRFILNYAIEPSWSKNAGKVVPQGVDKLTMIVSQLQVKPLSK